ncbi:nucleotidyltransferase domain-containing protein [Candidatus Woesearchaeota archaeon]|nr:nucleotidyltransferase domain-containing protein [Candidatus Woesearchaeota archaeon]
MAKKHSKKSKIKSKKNISNIAKSAKGAEPSIPKEAEKKLKEMKTKLDKFKKKVMEKFEEYVVGISLLPPSKDDKEKKKINIMALMDDMDSQKMSKMELHKRLSSILEKTAADVDKNLDVKTVLLTQLWESCYDAKYELLTMLARSAPIYDTGMLAAIRLGVTHKEMVLEKFEKYIVAYVLGGSLVQGKATSKSDIDIFIVVDDTDVKKMSRAELKDKLRAIIIGMGIDAGKMTGIENKLNVQVYILTDFWENIKEANPVIFTFLRDGVPFYDRGIFMPWKNLLKMGRIQPSAESIDKFKSMGDEIVKRAKLRLVDLVIEDLYYAALTPSQAAIMLYGLPPSTPRETPKVMEDIFVKKESMMNKNELNVLEELIEIRKRIEHGDKKDISGKKVDDLLKKTEVYIKRINELFREIEDMKEKESVKKTYDSIVTIIRDILKLEGVIKMDESDMVKLFESEIINMGLMPKKYLRQLKDVVKARKDYDKNKLTKTEVKTINKDSMSLMKYFIEYIQRKRGRELERTKIRVKHGNKYGEIIMLGKKAFIIHDIDEEEKDISKAEITEEGRLVNIEESSLEEMEQAITQIEIPQKAFIKEPIFEDLKDIFGKDVEVLMNY